MEVIIWNITITITIEVMLLTLNMNSEDIFDKYFKTKAQLTTNANQVLTCLKSMQIIKNPYKKDFPYKI